MISRIKKYFDHFLMDLEKAPAFYLWISFLIVMIFLGVYALLMSLIHSMEILEFDTNMPWEMMVSTYIFLVGSSVGLCLVSSMGSVFGLKRFEILGRRGLFLSLITVILGLLSINLHLGHPERGAYLTLTPNVRSAMWWMVIFYPPYILFTAVWYWLLVRRDLLKKAAESDGLTARVYRLMALEGLRPYLYERFPLRKWEAGIYRRLPLEKMGLSLDSGDAELRWARIFGVLSLFFAFLAYTVEGSLFAHVEARPFWYGVMYPFDFFIGACFCGLAWLLAMGIVTYKAKGEEIPSDVGDLYFEMAQLLAFFLSAGLIFTAYKMGHGLFEPSKARTIALFLNGPFSNAFWIFEIAIGAVFPILLLLYAARTRRINGLLVASIMVLVGYFVKRYDFVVGSQVYPLIKQPYPQFSYLPATMEVFLIGGIVGALLLAYTLGVKFLPLEEKHLPNAH